jgi:hypothetical protein
MQLDPAPHQFGEGWAASAIAGGKGIARKRHHSVGRADEELVDHLIPGHLTAR